MRIDNVYNLSTGSLELILYYISPKWLKVNLLITEITQLRTNKMDTDKQECMLLSAYSNTD